jgi:hypothetical protein
MSFKFSSSFYSRSRKDAGGRLRVLKSVGMEHSTAQGSQKTNTLVMWVDVLQRKEKETQRVDFGQLLSLNILCQHVRIPGLGL